MEDRHKILVVRNVLFRAGYDIDFKDKHSETILKICEKMEEIGLGTFRQCVNLIVRAFNGK